MKARSLPVPTKKPGHDTDAMYDTYLINFLKCSLAKESENNQEDVRLFKLFKLYRYVHLRKKVINCIIYYYYLCYRRLQAKL